MKAGRHAALEERGAGGAGARGPPQIRPLGLTQYDDTGGNIGKRYRRQDEIGTPYCITVDFESLEDQQVTIRERDSMEQRRVPIAELRAILAADLAS